MRKCSESDCQRDVLARGWCSTHYSRWVRTGTTHLPDRMETFVSKVEITDFCWNWQGYITTAGYGSFSTNNKPTYVHRWIYEQVVEPIPDGLQIDHLCMNRRCVNPDHLEPVTQAENIRRSTSPEKLAAANQRRRITQPNREMSTT